MWVGDDCKSNAQPKHILLMEIRNVVPTLWWPIFEPLLRSSIGLLSEPQDVGEPSSISNRDVLLVWRESHAPNSAKLPMVANFVG